MVYSNLEPKTECLRECHLECHPKCHPECHPECKDQLDMVRSHTVMVCSHFFTNKSLVVSVRGGGGEWQTKFRV